MRLEGQTSKWNLHLVSTPQPTLLFLHVPKTGGVSLSTLLGERFSPREVFHLVSNPGTAPQLGGIQGTCEDFRSLSEEQRTKFRCIFGHFHFAESIHVWLQGPYSYITLIRDPIDRIRSQLSQFNRMVLRGEMPDHQQPVDLHTFAQLHPNSVNNHQTRFLCGGHYPHYSAEENLNRAKDTLRSHFGVIGTTERYHDFLRVLGGTFGWSDLRFIRRNTSKDTRNRSFTEAETTWLAERNQADLHLHKFATQLLDENMIHLQRLGRLPAPFPTANNRRRRTVEVMQNARRILSITKRNVWQGKRS